MHGGQLDALQHNGMTNSKMEIWNWKSFIGRWQEHHMRLVFLRNDRVLREDNEETDKNLC